ncbi:MAG: MerR family transcriptional regulator [Candidatus Lindowbacteria bacterium]|nr:MerR family transcriptional regulator [Candidatus Lindowbacteria bacterium]
MYTIGRLARKFGLSRSTLLYYDSIGLLRSSARTESQYRQYSESDSKRLEQICRYRRAGLSLKEIASVLDSRGNNLTKALEKRLEELNDDIGRLREQQRFILGILKGRQYRRRVKVMNAEVWMSLLRASGFSDKDMLRWHVEFERLAPEKHQEFLEFLCIPDEDIGRIRSMGRG